MKLLPNHAQLIATLEGVAGTRSKKKKSSRRNVSFNHVGTVNHTIALCHYTQKEIKACWYNRDELDVIKHECKKTLKKVESGKVLNSRKYSAHGLDQFFQAEKDIIELNIINGRLAVLEEQKCQKQKGIYDPENISRAYHIAATQRCQTEAMERGRRDEQLVSRANVRLTAMAA